jgi:hypothetical protein
LTEIGTFSKNLAVFAQKLAKNEEKLQKIGKKWDFLALFAYIP